MNYRIFTIIMLLSLNLFAAIDQIQPIAQGKVSLHSNFSVGQSFVPEQKQLSRVSFFIKGPGKKLKDATTEVKLSLRLKWHGAKLAEASVPAKDISPAGQWVDFKFEPVANLIPGKSYMLRLDYKQSAGARCFVFSGQDYFYNLYPQGQALLCWMRGGVKKAKNFDLAFKTYSPAKEVASNKNNDKIFMINVDYSDNFNLSWAGPDGFGGNPEISSKQEIINALKQIKACGADGVFWRVSFHGVMYHSKIRKVFSMKDAKSKYQRNLAKALKECDPLKVAVEEGHKLGLKVYAWVLLNDSGSSNGRSWEKQLLEHPEYQWSSRDSKKHLAGVACYAYKAVRENRLAQMKELMQYGVDGLFMSTRSHTTGFGKRVLNTFGFNKPVADAFLSKYGIDIKKDFKKERDGNRLIILRGQLMNKFYREVKQLRDKEFPAAKLAADLSHVPQDWPEWVRGNLVDYIVVNSVSGNYGVIPSGKEYKDIPDFYVDAVKEIKGKTQSNTKVLMWIQVVNYKTRKYHVKEQIYDDIFWLGKSRSFGGVFHEHCGALHEPERYWSYMEKALKNSWNK